LAPCEAHLADLTKNFTNITYTYLPLEDNQFMDGFMKLSLMINILGGIHTMPWIAERRNKPIHYHAIQVFSIDLTT